MKTTTEPMTEHLVARSGTVPLAFEGICLANVSGQHLGEPRHPHRRWHEISVYRTQKGRYVVGVAYRSTWAGEVDDWQAYTLDNPLGVQKLLESINPVEKMIGLPHGTQGYEERQRALLLDVSQRYRECVRLVLTSSPEFAERLD